ncbi:MAG: hypothetical protein RJB26_2402 [Pseudomonadota bacterium]
MNLNTSTFPVGLKAGLAIGLAVTLALGVGMATLADAADKEAAAPAKGTSLTVTVASPQREDWSTTLAASGSIEPWDEASIASEVNGQRIAVLLANVGDHVRKGQPLARFAEDFLAADLAQAEAALEEATAREAQARANHERSRTLADSNALSPLEMDQYAANARSAAAQLQSAKARRNAAALLLRKATVVAPDNGVISSRTATTGLVAGVGTELFRLIRQERLEWRAEVAEVDMGRVKPGVKAQLRTSQGVTLEGRVRAVSPKVDARSRTALAYVDLPGAASHTVAGTFATGRLLLAETPALTIPQSAVVTRDGFAYVFVVDAHDQVHRTRVTTGRRQGDRFEITGGLPANVRIAFQGAGFLNDGDRVRVVAKKDARP